MRQIQGWRCDAPGCTEQHGTSNGIICRNAIVSNGAPGSFRAFGVAVRLELSERASEPPTALNLGYRTGAQHLVAILEEMRAAGVHHVAFNITDSKRPVPEVLDELAATVLPAFHANDSR